jgi:CelD/BcsL family acetyltransferase involved in cellulose biosynthesis
LRGGYASYVERRARAGSRQIVETERKARKLAREIGPLRFEARTKDASVLDAVFAWKSAQCRATGVNDYFAWGWPRELVARISSTREGSFGGAVSALWAGDSLVAAHMGMHDENVWHWWFPVYDHVHARYSPGAILLLRLAEAAAGEGKELLDLGKGGEEYKSRFADFDTPIAEGFLARRTLAGAMLGARVQVESWLRSSSLFDPLRPAVRRVRRWTTTAQF